MKLQSRNSLIVVAAVVVAFGGGAAWQFAQARQARQALDDARQEMAVIRAERALEKLESTLALATVAAQFGEFERGRQLASNFFDLLQEQAGTARQTPRSSLYEILSRRDGIITVLSRGQPESGYELASLLVSLQNALGRERTLSGFQQPDSTEAAQRE